VETSKYGVMRKSEPKEIIKMNIKSFKLDMGCLRYVLDLKWKRTTYFYGYHHYCRTHKDIVDFKPIGCCDLLNKSNQYSKNRKTSNHSSVYLENRDCYTE